MKCLSVLPNFTILADCTEEYNNSLMGILRCFCEVVSSVEHVDNYRITPESFWQGLNRTQDMNVDFLGILEANAKEAMPENVLTDLKDWQSKYGVITTLGDDCLLIKDADLLTEIQNSSSLDPHLDGVEGNVLFFKNTSFSKLQELFQYEFSHPIKYRLPNVKTFIIEDGYKRYAVKSANEFEAIKSLYGTHPLFTEDDLRNRLGHKKAEVSEEDVDNYINLILSDPSDRPCSLSIKAVPSHANYKPIIF